jgi:uncharacterized protein (DUF2164 family)
MSSQKINELLEEYRLYNPEEYIQCESFERCKFLLESRFNALITHRIRNLKSNNESLALFKRRLEEIKADKIQFYRNKYLEEDKPVLKDIEVPEWMAKWVNITEGLLNEFDEYIPHIHTGPKTLDRYEELINSNYRAILEWKLDKYTNETLDKRYKDDKIYKKYLDNFKEKLLEKRNEKIEEYRIKFTDEEMIKKLEKVKFTPAKVKIYIPDTTADVYYNQSIKEAKKKTSSNVFYNQSIKEAKKKISTKKHQREAINIWKEKIAEIISAFANDELKCNSVKECKDKIRIGINIIKSFILDPNKMLFHPLSASVASVAYVSSLFSKETYQKNKIYTNFLSDYKNDIIDLQYPEYIQLSEEFIIILKIQEKIKIENIIIQ